MLTGWTYPYITLNIELIKQSSDDTKIKIPGSLIFIAISFYNLG